MMAQKRPKNAPVWGDLHMKAPRIAFLKLANPCIFIWAMMRATNTFTNGYLKNYGILLMRTRLTAWRLVTSI
jgi:hypothetical protein